MAQYRYLFYDFVTNAALGDLELTDVDYARKLNDAGDINFRVNLGDPRVLAKNPMNLTQPPAINEPARKVYVEREGALVWGGLIWHRAFDDSTHQLVVHGKELWSYFQARGGDTGRFIVDTLTWTQQDQFDIFRDLVNYAQGQQLNTIVGAPKIFPKTGGNAGIVVSGPGGSGVLRDRTYDATAYQDVGAACLELSQVINGFDFSIDVAYVSGVPTAQLVLSYPRRGQTFQAGTGIIFEKPGNLLGYIHSEDGTQFADVSYAIGDGEGGSILRSASSRTDLFDQGQALFERRRSYKGSGINQQATMDGHAIADVNAAAASGNSWQVRVAASSPQQSVGALSIGSFTTGDDARLRITDEFFPNPGYGGADQHLDQYVRILNYKVEVPLTHQIEQVTVDLAQLT